MAAKTLPRPAHLTAIGIKRVSLLKQVGNYSFDGQGNKFALLEQRFNCSIPPELMIEDKGYSGTDFNRPSIRRAKEMIRDGVANAVAFPWLDRFAREVEGGLATIREFRELGAEVLLGDLGWYQDSGWYKAQMHMFLTIAQYQRDDIADKSKWGVQAKLQRGLAHFGAPFGWHMVTALEIAARAVARGEQVPVGRPQNYFERVPEDLEIVQLIGELALAGGRDGSLKGICRELNARGFKSPKTRWLEARGDKTQIARGFNPVFVRDIVKDEIYSTGIWHYGKREFVEPKKVRDTAAERHRVRTTVKYRPRDQWAGSLALPGGPIWTPDEHVAIQEALKRNGTYATGKPPRSANGREAVLRRMCICGATLIETGEECGGAVAPMHSSFVKADGTRSLYYHCSYRHKSEGHHLCDGKSARAIPLEEAVWERTKKAVLVELDALIAAHFAAIVAEEDQDVLERLREERKLKAQYRQNAMREKVQARSEEDRRVYADLMVQYEAEIALLDRRIGSAASDAGEAATLDTASLQRDAREGFEATEPADRRAILTHWVHQVKFNGGADRPGGLAHGEVEITIRVTVANGKHAEPDVAHKQHLYLTVKTRLAA
jgi:DNA invertase Pin-like site-specific DNA recombinase